MVNMHVKRLFVFKLRILCSSDHPILLKFRQLVLRGNCTPNQILACFVFYLKIINTFSKNDICILQQIVQEIEQWNWNFSRSSRF